MPAPAPITSERFCFSKPDRFLYHDIAAAIGEVAGIYRLHLTDGKGSFLTVPRLLESDRNGIVYIGTASRLNGRLGELQKALSVAYGRNQWTASRHGVLSKLRSLPRFIERFPYENLCVTVQPLPTVAEGHPDQEAYDDHFGQERSLLRAYREWYGEYPTLNVQ